MMLRNIGCVERAIIGNYRLSFGKGLVINNGMKLSKAMMLSTANRMNAGITKHSSTNESGHFTGAAATITLKHWKFSAFGSYQSADGTYNSDSTGMSSLKTDGLHRTRLERSKKNNLHIPFFFFIFTVSTPLPSAEKQHSATQSSGTEPLALIPSA